MKILFIIPEMNRGGAEKVLAYIANYFTTQKDCKVFLAVYDCEKSAYQLEKTIEYMNLKCTENDLRMRLPIIFKIRRIIKAEEIDVVVGFSTGVSELLPFSVAGLCCRCIGSERSNPYLKKFSKSKKWLHNKILECLDGMIFTTRGCRDYYSKKIISKSVVIPNGFHREDGFAFNQNDRKRSKDILAVGNLRKVKDYPTMLNGFKLFSENHDEFILNIYGEGIEEQAIRNLIKKLDLCDKVILHGSVDNLKETYKNSSFMIHSSTSESWCNAILEALSFGVPCIAADCDFGPREMIINGENGFLYEVGNSQQLADCMSCIVDDTNLLCRMGAYAYEEVKRFEFDKIAERYYAFVTGTVVQ